MSLHYLLDGYNITKQIPAFERGKLKGERDSLIHFIEVSRPQGSRNNKVTVIFDGRAGIIHPQGSLNVEVIFSQDESGDEKIRSIIQSAKNKKNIIVVTDDKELRFSVRALGAKVLEVREFLSKINIEPAGPRNEKPPKTNNEDAKNISKTLEYKITTEFEKIWLKKD